MTDHLRVLLCLSRDPELRIRDIAVQRLQMGDVMLADRPEHGREVEAMVVREIEPMDTGTSPHRACRGR